MFLQNFVLILITLNCINGEIWKLPTATDIQTSLETCQTVLNAEDDSNAFSEIDIRCISKQLGLWSDDEGFISKRFVKLLQKYQKPIEIVVVIGYCNKTHKQTDLGKWASEAYLCFAKGRIGVWINEYLKNVYNNKITN